MLFTFLTFNLMWSCYINTSKLLEPWGKVDINSHENGTYGIRALLG